MAEFVQQRLERMLPELKALKKSPLFTEDEISTIIACRRRFEYKIYKHTKCKEDFLQYAQYEVNFLELLRKRREALRYYAQRDEIDNAVIMRVYRLLKQACYRFQADLTMWLTATAFCIKYEKFAEASALFARALQVHSHRPELWIRAAEHEFQNVRNPETTRALLLKALRYPANKQNESLWLAYYAMELKYADMLHKRMKILSATSSAEAHGTGDRVVLNLGMREPTSTTGGSNEDDEADDVLLDRNAAIDTEDAEQRQNDIIEGRIALIVAKNALKQLTNPSKLFLQRLVNVGGEHQLAARDIYMRELRRIIRKSPSQVARAARRTSEPSPPASQQ